MTDASDPVSRLQALSRTGAFNNWLGLEIVAATLGEVELRLPWRPEFAQYHGFLHASIMGGLIDTACGFAAFLMSGEVTASQFSVRFLRPAVADVFVVKGRVVKPGRRQIFAAAELFGLGAPEKPFAVGDAILIPLA
jgi:uncharacterized protein (TIGR00369 family)